MAPFTKTVLRTLLIGLMFAGTLSVIHYVFFDPCVLRPDPEWLGPTRYVYRIRPMVWIVGALVLAMGVLMVAFLRPIDKRRTWTVLTVSTVATITSWADLLMRKVPDFEG